MYIIIDLETGGYNKKKHGICEIGAIKADQDGNILDEFEVLIKPYAEYTPEAMAVNGISLDDMAENGVSPEEAIVLLIEFMDGSDCFIGHNIKNFDLPFLQHFFEKFSYDLQITDYIDTLILAREQRGGGRNSLSNLCEDFGIINDYAHRALSDCKATLEVWEKLR